MTRMTDPQPKPPKKPRGVYESPKGSGIWWCQHYTPDRHRERVGRKSDAIALYHKRKADFRAGVKLAPLNVKGTTFGQLIDLALAFAEENGRLLRNYTDKAEILRADFGDCIAEDILPSEFTAWLKKRGSGAATCNRYRSFISLCYREGQRDNRVKSNPARLIHSKAESRGRYRFLDRQTEYPLVAAKMAEQYPTRVRAFTFSVFSGARLSEEFDLRWADVNFRDREITFRDTKNGEDRTIPTNSIMLGILTELRAEHPKSKGTVFGDLREFCCLPGAKLAEEVADDGYSPKWFRALCAELGIEDYTWHNNRHTFCSWLAQDGASLKEIQELAGHKDISTTARYSHLSPDRRSSVMERLVTPINSNVVEIRTAIRTAIAG